MIRTEARNAGLQDMVALLQEQQARKIDMVVPASRLRSIEGEMQVSGVEVILNEDGVTDANGLYRPTEVFDEGVSEKLGIPLAYMRRLRGSRPDLIDANVNGWLHGRKPKMRGEEVIREAVPGDERSFLFRAFRGDADEKGIGRALLSDRFAIADNLDVLMATLDGIREIGREVVIDRASLTERRMSVDIVCPEVQVLAEGLLKGYRNPFGSDFERWRGVADREGLGYGGEEPVVWAGLNISNSETGDGAFRVVPKMKIKVCANGLVITKDAVRSVHLGGRLDRGVVRWSQETEEKNVALVKAKTRDAVMTFLDVEYMQRVIADLTEKGEKPVEDHDEVKVITKRAKFTDAQTAEILKFFTRGGQMNRAGVMAAVTAAAQMQPNADTAFEMEEKALAVLTA